MKRLILSIVMASVLVLTSCGGVPFTFIEVSNGLIRLYDASFEGYDFISANRINTDIGVDVVISLKKAR